jgi:predicted small lipoprotein YifL
MRLVLALSLALLAACGADGPPVAPSKATATPGITVSGEAKFGIGYSE